MRLVKGGWPMTQAIRNKHEMLKYIWTGALIAVFVLLIAVFFYLDRLNEISVIIQNWGRWGVVFAIVLMAAVCITPIPSEGVVVLFFKIYGIYQGIFFAWVGSMLSAVVIFILAVSYTHLRAHETDSYLVCRLLLEK